jgi:hypothetical protein
LGIIISLVPRFDDSGRYEDMMGWLIAYIVLVALSSSGNYVHRYDRLFLTPLTLRWEAVEVYTGGF